jgi:transcriptional regulator with XRE-family HTH domain
MERFAEALGEAIRHARQRAHLSLRDLERRSAGRFKPSAVGGYERGERDISAERLVELSFAIGIAPEELLADSLARLLPNTYTEVAIDLVRLRDARNAEARAVNEFARRIRTERNDLAGDVVTVRAGDLQIIAGEAGTDVPSLLRAIEPAVVRVGPEE